MKNTIKKIIITITMLAMAVMPSLTINNQTVAAASYHCGATCNGKSAYTPLSSNGITCSKSSKIVAVGNPKSNYVGGKGQAVTEVDTATTVKLIYSTTCQTLWAVTTNGHTGTPSSCSVTMTRTASPTHSHSSPCPGPSVTTATPMVDDYVASQGVAAKVTFTGIMYRNICVHQISPDECSNIQNNAPITFTYTKAY